MAITRSICGVTRYNPVGRRVGSSTLVVKKNENKVKKAGGNSLE